MLNIKQLTMAVMISIMAVTHVSAEKISIYDDADFVANKSFYNLIDEAARAELSEKDCARFMGFVQEFSIKNRDNYNTSLEGWGSLSRWEDRAFILQHVCKVENHVFAEEDITLTQKGSDKLNKQNSIQTKSSIVCKDLFHGLCGIVLTINSNLLDLDGRD